MRIKFSETEIIDLLWAWAAISFAFAVVFAVHATGVRGFMVIRAIGSEFFTFLIVSGITVGVAFIFHEMAHKFVAQRYGCWAEFRKFNFGLILAVMISFWGLILAAPGAVMIDGMVSREQNGKISIAGSLTNIILALLFLAVGYMVGATTPLINMIIFYGFFINAFLALFNMIPVPPLDGSKVIAWSFSAWLAVAAVSGFMVASVFLGFF